MLSNIATDLAPTPRQSNQLDTADVIARHTEARVA
jgi:hypothetical protein